MQVWDAHADHVPHELEVDPEIAMDQPVAHAGDATPVDVLVRRAELGGPWASPASTASIAAGRNRVREQSVRLASAVVSAHAGQAGWWGTTYEPWRRTAYVSKALMIPHTGGVCPAPPNV